MNWLLKLLTDALVGFMLGTIEAFQSLFNNIFEIMWKINTKLDLSKLTNYLITLALAYVGFLVIKQALCTYVFQIEGDSESDPLEICTRTSISVMMIYCGPYVITKLIQLASTISTEVQKKIVGLDMKQGKGKSFSDNLKKTVEYCYDSSNFKVQEIGCVYILMLLFLLVALIIFLFQAAKRGAELLTFQLLLPILATDLITTNREKWQSFFSELMICIFGYIIQVTAFSIFSYLFARGADNPTELLNYTLASLGWIMVVISAPKWLTKFLYTSGVGNGMKGGVRTATYVLPQVFRK